jgi:two-component sensor histidine kinase
MPAPAWTEWKLELIRSFGTLSERIGRSRPLTRYRRSGGRAVTAVLVGIGALIFDSVTPQIISVGMLYVGLVLIGFWYPNPRDVFALALLATLLIIAGYWVTIPDEAPAWEAWLNRALAIGTVWMAALFVWHIRVLEQKLQRQVDIAKALSSEMNHRIGNHLQLVASFLRLQSTSTVSEESRRALELAGSRVMVIGNIHRMLSHSAGSQGIDSKAFILAIIKEVRLALPDPDKVGITVRADAASLTSTKAVAVGACLLEVINNALKHAFPDGMNGMLTVSFAASNKTFIVECEDDGVGIEQARADGFGTQNITDLARLMGASITCQPARQSDTRPGTMWRLVIPA